MDSKSGCEFLSVDLYNRRSRHVKTVHGNCTVPNCDDGAYTEVCLHLKLVLQLVYTQIFISAL